jgi:hypothetical protein
MAITKELEKRWVDEANKQLKGKTIQRVRYMSQKEVEDNMWYKRGVVIHFTDGSIAYPSADDEGNDSGVIFGIDKDSKEYVLPSLY